LAASTPSWRKSGASGEPQPALNADARLACRRELQRLMAVVHPNVVICLGSVKGAPALLYELHSCDLRNYMQQFNGTLDAQQRSFLALDAARALSFLHRRAPPIVVGNVSTAHFLVDSSGNVRISSLYGDGAHLTNKANPAFGDVASAAAIASWCRDVVWNVDVAFAAREVLARGALSTASDVYALGVVLFEVLTGAVPWAEASVPQIIQHVLHQDRLPCITAAAAVAAAGSNGDDAAAADDDDESIVHQLLLGCTHRLPQSRPAMVDVSLLLFEHVSAAGGGDDEP
jgi:serine/threonine protein kinase